MADNTDQAKGRLKEGVGDLTGDEGLQREGEVDQAKGGLKDKVDQAADKAKDLLNRDR